MMTELSGPARIYSTHSLSHFISHLLYVLKHVYAFFIYLAC